MTRSDSPDSFPVPLICPRCRVPGPEGGLRIFRLEPIPAGREPAHPEGGDLCRNCGSSYPRIDGIRCVPPDLDAFKQAQSEALKPDWLADGPSVAAACRSASHLNASGGEIAEAQLPAIYAQAHFPEGLDADYSSDLLPNLRLWDLLEVWLRKHLLPGAAAGALEAGCGPGRLLHLLGPRFSAGAVGLDIRLSLLRAARRLASAGSVALPFRSEGRHFEPATIRASKGILAPPSSIHLVQGDIQNPPFEAEAFSLVAALSLLDSVPDPIFALGQLDALLVAGGLLLLGTPYHWDARVTPVSEWWSEKGGKSGSRLRAALSGRDAILPHLGFEMLEEAEHIPWTLPGHGRVVHRYFLDLILARKC